MTEKTYNKRDIERWEELSPEERDKQSEVALLLREGNTRMQVAIQMGLSERTIYRIIQRIKLRRAMEG